MEDITADHYVVYIDNNFFCTSDTYSEAANESLKGENND